MRAKVEKSKSLVSDLEYSIERMQEELTQANETRGELALSCDTFDQALENVLREVIYLT